ncbi:glycosyltransferase family A protein [uncultured Roseovarius sp.]|uniref:glycosyltransferase family 2 protein n=1 Tax=uncultured Roseovarius sp. TaxID=293344 RepID=UPI002636215B|nr:glycosyltransferase family A protein [uncultured Roseovarius sp.]
MSQPRLSICIPAYDMGGKGAEFLAASFDRLQNQSFTDFEVVVSDQSDSDGVAQVCARYGQDLTIRRVDFRDGPRQSSANANNAMRHASGRILKILFQDDFLCRDDALEQIAGGFDDPARRWLLCGSGVCRDGVKVEKPMVPRLNARLRFGRNTVSSPSVLAIRAEVGLHFDENLIWLMDVEFYDRCAQQLGAPVILPEMLVANRLHEGQVSAIVTKSRRRAELRHVWRKTKARAGWRDFRAFAYQFLKAL